MLPFKNILSPTDFSEPSYKAIKLAGELAQHFKSSLVVLHVASVVTPLGTAELPVSFNLEGFQKRVETDALRQLQEVTGKLVPKDLTGLVLRVTSGYYPEEILRVAIEERSDLIVIGTRGRTGLPHALLGSVAERVVQLSSCPVLTVGRTVSVQLPAGLTTPT